MAYDRSKTVGRVAFLAHRDAIRDLLDKGHRNKEVFAKLEDQLTISYSQFNRYVVRYITGANDDRHQRKGPCKALSNPLKEAQESEQWATPPHRLTPAKNAQNSSMILIAETTATT